VSPNCQYYILTYTFVICPTKVLIYLLIIRTDVDTFIHTLLQMTYMHIIIALLTLEIAFKIYIYCPPYVVSDYHDEP